MGERDLLERVRDIGVCAAAAVDLVVIGFARRAEDVETGTTTAVQILQRFGSLRALGEASASEIHEITGLEDFEITRVQALIELGRRAGNTLRGDVDVIESVSDVFTLLGYLQDEKREHFMAILLDSKGRVLRVAEIHVGTLTASIVGPREIFREAIREGASSIIVAHNHPSGDTAPSAEDIEITRQLVEIGHMLDIPVLDHVIIGYREARSLKDGKVVGRQMGRSHIGVARESSSYARSEGIGAWVLS